MGDGYRPGEPRRYDSDRNYRRPRSRTPPRGYNGGGYRGGRGGRSPLRRDDRRDIRRARSRSRSPLRDVRRLPSRAARGYHNDRDLITRRRSRSRSPLGRPRGGYRDYQRPRSPDRRDIRVRSPDRRMDCPRSPDRRDSRYSNAQSSSNWRGDSRRRSPSPHPRRSPSPVARDTAQSSAQTSGSTSRHGSPPIHPSRLQNVPALRSESRARSPAPRSPPVQGLAYRDRVSARSTPRELSPAPPAHVAIQSPPRPTARSPPPKAPRSPPRSLAPRSPPRGPSGFKAPTGPNTSRNFTPTRSPVVTHASLTRGDSSGPPAGPRGYVSSSRGSYRGRGGRGSFGGDRSDRPDWGAAPNRPIDSTKRSSPPVARPSPTAALPAAEIVSPTAPVAPAGPSASNAIPTGPRAGARPINPTSNIWSRTQSMSAASGPRPHPALANLPQLIPGGREDPTMLGMTVAEAAKMKRLTEEEAVVRETFESKSEKLRKDLIVYERLKRESRIAGLRSELSEAHVRALAGEGVGGAAF